MGWVKQKIEDHQMLTGASISSLWNTLRDSVGEAVAEYKALVSQPGVDHMDCQARGTMCIRVQKPGKFIEIFIAIGTVKAGVGDITLNGSSIPNDSDVCGYRIKEDRSALEFFADGAAISANDVARRALEDFLFKPFPQYLRPAL